MSDESNLSIQCDTLQQILQTAVEAAGSGGKVVTLDLPASERGERYVLIDKDGKHEFVTPNPPPRKHSLGNLEQVTEFVAYVKDTFDANPVVWHNDAGVAVIIDDSVGSQRRDRATLRYEKTPEFRLLEKWAADKGSQAFTQKQLVLLLRVELSDVATESSSDLLAKAKAMSGITSSAARGKVDHGRESLGRDIEAEVSSEIGDIPEVVEFSVRLLTDPLRRVRYPIKCAVDIDPQTLNTRLIPRPADVRDALQSEADEIAMYLDKECECPVFYGKSTPRDSDSE